MTAVRSGIVTLLASMFVLTATALAQPMPAADTLIASRQAEIVSLARQLYGLDMQQPGWVHERVDLCPVFTHHVFALYQHMSAKEVTATFVAIYPFGSRPASSLEKPWQGGILLLPHHGIGTRETPLFADRQSTRATFNRVWTEERLAGLAPVDKGVLASCFARVAGEVPVSPEIDGTAAIAPAPPPETLVTNVQVPLAAVAGGSRWLSLEFDKDGLISDSKVQEVRAEYPHRSVASMR